MEIARLLRICRREKVRAVVHQKVKESQNYTVWRRAQESGIQNSGRELITWDK
jgi:hypothetical protein